MECYAEVSRRLHAIFADYTPLIEPLSLDEAFLDVTGSLALMGTDISIGRAIQSRISTELGLVASVGIAPNKYLAKLASDLEKPNGFVVIGEENKQAILDPLPVKRIWGVGKVMQQTLTRHGIETIRQLRQMPLEWLEGNLGRASGASLYRLARGMDDRSVEPEHEAKSLSSERTFAEDVTDKTELERVLLAEVERVATRLRRQKLYAKTATLKIRYGDFRTITRRSTLSQSTCLTERLREAARALFNTWQKTAFGPVRLIGFGVTGLSAEEGRQLELFPDPNEQRLRQLDRVIDQVRERYGGDALQRRHEE
jgi:DNA polymerase-4